MIVCDYLKLHPQSDMAFRVPQNQRQSSKVQYVSLQQFHICYMVHMGAPCTLYRVHLENQSSESSDLSPPSLGRLGRSAQAPALGCGRPQRCEGPERDLQWGRR